MIHLGHIHTTKVKGEVVALDCQTLIDPQLAGHRMLPMIIDLMRAQTRVKVHNPDPRAAQTGPNDPGVALLGKVQEVQPASVLICGLVIIGPK